MSAVPIQPRGAPPCFVINPAYLSEAQIQRLAAMAWQAEENSPQSQSEIEEEIRSIGIPIRTSYFCALQVEGVYVSWTSAPPPSGQQCASESS